MSTATYTQYRLKCLECGLHFIICTDHPESHALTTIYCPECGQHHGHYLMYRTAVPGFIFQAVPGDAEMTDVSLPGPKEASHG